ncbi:MAG TPA: hypothetical protein PLS03_03455 [Terrimicrobiaceae bacterium]|nr:hypothetical protein [Terrimicrobiaceae bacterium]
MIRFLKSLAGFLACFRALTLLAAPLPEEGNWGFETATQGQATGWRQSPEYPYDRVESTPDAREGGSAAVELVFENPDEGAQAHYYGECPISPEPDVDFRVSVWAKGSGRLALLAYVYGLADHAEKFLRSIPFRPEETPGGGSIDVSPEWTQHHFTIPAADLPREPFSLRIVLAATGTVTVDDLSAEAN